MESFDGLPLALANGIGVVGVVLIVGWMLWTGRLYTRPHVDQMQKSHDAELARMEKAHEREMEDERHDKGEWRTESRIKDQTIVELSEQNRLLQAFGETLADFLQGLRRAGIGREVESGDRE